MATRHMDAALGRLGASLQEELNSTLQPLVQQIVIQSTQICVDLCKDRLSELLDQVENRGAPVDPVYTAVTKGRGPTPEEAARASAKLLVSAALLSSGVLVEAPETVGFTTQSTQTVTVPVPVAPVPVVPVAPSATAATVATAAATASITSHSATGTPATAAKAAAPMAPSPVAKKATPVPKAAQAAQAFKAMPQKAPPLQPQAAQAAQAASPLPVPKPKVEPRKSFAEQVAVGVSSIFGKSTPPKAKSKESVQTGPPPSVMSMIRKSYQAAAKSEEQPKDVKEEKTPIPKPKTPGRVSTRSVQALPRKTQRSSAVGEEDLSV